MRKSNTQQDTNASIREGVPLARRPCCSLVPRYLSTHKSSWKTTFPIGVITFCCHPIMIQWYSIDTFIQSKASYSMDGRMQIGSGHRTSSYPIMHSSYSVLTAASSHSLLRRRLLHFPSNVSISLATIGSGEYRGTNWDAWRQG